MAFTLTIDTAKKCFGETETAKRQKICQLLQDAIQIIGSGRAPQPLRMPASGHQAEEIVGEYSLTND